MSDFPFPPTSEHRHVCPQKMAARSDYIIAEAESEDAFHKSEWVWVLGFTGIKEPQQVPLSVPHFEVIRYCPFCGVKLPTGEEP